MKTYSLEVIEAAIRSLILEGSGQEVMWLVCLAREVQQDKASWVGTVYSMSTNRPVGVGKQGQPRRVMDSREEAHEWFERAIS